jgi:hypothetical protein
MLVENKLSQMIISKEVKILINTKIQLSSQQNYKIYEKIQRLMVKIKSLAKYVKVRTS